MVNYLKLPALPKTPLLSVIIVTWNRKEDVLETLAEVYKQNYPKLEVLVIDNASSDDTVVAIEKHFPQVKLLVQKTNLGATGGRNKGIEAAKGDILFFLDSDSSLGEHTLQVVADKFLSDPSIGALACKVLNAYTGTFAGAGWIYSELDKVDQDKEFLSFSVPEAGVPFRKDALDLAGPFWDFLFFGREGEELCLRLWDKGIKIMYYPEAVIHHREVLAKGKQSRIKGGKREYYDFRNSLYIYLTRYPTWLIWRFLPLRVVVVFVRSFKRRNLAHFFKALWDVTRQLPKLQTLRQPIRQDTAQFYVELMKQHGPLRWNLQTWLRHKL